MSSIRSALCFQAVIILGVAALPAKDFPKYPVRPASDYALHQSRQCVHVALEPVTDHKAQKRYLGMDFTRRGYLPLLIVVENTNTSGSVIVRRDEIVILDADKQQSVAHGSALPPGTSRTGAIIAGALMGAPVTMIIGLKMMGAASEVKQNVLKTELRTRTIAAGEFATGFLYLSITGKNGLTLRVPVSTTSDSQPLQFDFPLSTPGGQ